MTASKKFDLSVDEKDTGVPVERSTMACHALKWAVCMSSGKQWNDLSHEEIEEALSGKREKIVNFLSKLNITASSRRNSAGQWEFIFNDMSSITMDEKQEDTNE